MELLEEENAQLRDVAYRLAEQKGIYPEKEDKKHSTFEKSLSSI